MEVKFENLSIQLLNLAAPTKEYQGLQVLFNRTGGHMVGFSLPGFWFSFFSLPPKVEIWV